jgi:hypothetical protein
MTTASPDPALQLLRDRAAIEDCLMRYAHAVDRADAELLGGVYWPDGIDDRGFWRGGAEEFVAFCRPIWARRDQMLHAISNVLIRIEGAEAPVQCYFSAYERVRGKNGAPPNDVTIIGRYLDRFQKRSGEWRILERRCVIDSWRVWARQRRLVAWGVRRAGRGRPAGRGGSVARSFRRRAGRGLTQLSCSGRSGSALAMAAR